MVTDTRSVKVSRSVYRKLRAYLKRRNLVSNARHFLDESILFYLQHHDLDGAAVSDASPRP